MKANKEEEEARRRGQASSTYVYCNAAQLPNKRLLRLNTELVSTDYEDTTGTNTVELIQINENPGCTENNTVRSKDTCPGGVYRSEASTAQRRLPLRGVYR